MHTTGKKNHNLRSSNQCIKGPNDYTALGNTAEINNAGAAAAIGSMAGNQVSYGNKIPMTWTSENRTFGLRKLISMIHYLIKHGACKLYQFRMNIWLHSRVLL
jgi:hypothetical protein